MIAKELISHDIVCLKTSDSGKTAEEVMLDFTVKHVPIVNDKELLGMISSDDILDENIMEPIGSYSLSLNRASVPDDMHIFNVMKYVSKFNLTVIPVVNDKKEYLGVIKVEDILNYFSNSFSFSETGSILILEMSRIDYSLAEISRIVESNNSVILSSFITQSYDSQVIYVTLKLNKENIGALLSSFERYDIKVHSSFSNSDYSEGLQDRYDSLMNYLSI